MRKSVILFGGGLDSAACAIRLHAAQPHRRLTLLHLDYGQVAATTERRATAVLADRLGAEHLVDAALDSWCRSYLTRVNPNPSLLFGTGDDKPFIDARNLVLVLAAASVAEEVVLGICREEGYMHPDACADGVRAFNTALSFAFPAVPRRVVAPQQDLPKLAMCQQAVALCPEFFALTMTCWTPVSGVECGCCPHCVKKSRLKEAVYASNP